jgi:hypothetical protein
VKQIIKTNFKKKDFNFETYQKIFKFKCNSCSKYSIGKKNLYRNKNLKIILFSNKIIKIIIKYEKNFTINYFFTKVAKLILKKILIIFLKYKEKYKKCIKIISNIDNIYELLKKSLKFINI